MKVAIFTDTFTPDVNGCARTLKRYTDFLEKKGIPYKVFAPESTHETQFSSSIRRFASLPFFLYPECRLALPNLIQMKAELREFRPDLIHIATPFNIGLAGLKYAKKSNIPVVGSYHTDFDQYLAYYDLHMFSKLLWKYMHWFHKSFQKIFVPSHETLRQLKMRQFRNLSIWKRGVDCCLFNPAFRTEKVREQYGIKERYLLSYVGRLAPEKDLETLLMTADHPSLQKDVHWLIAGDGPFKKELEKRAPANMTFAGYVKGEELSSIYASSDLFVFPSPTETFGNAALEALACGTPVVGADSGGLKDFIQHGKNGFLAEPKNPEAFAAHILEILSNDGLKKQMGEEARSYALAQSWDAIFERLLSECEGVLAECSGERTA
ncbi:glycosyltransferase family 4 protein [Bacillus glycinifermentans]|uniref:Glycosyl transferase n=1 Tax=Bacillus glycinifermentans TaxID=1664069 RepID=A0A0T6BSV1_9BACI|nr:glycosyltransferase family 1 protein [Bacillus glycinifermentans]ATH92862.1 glycosyltransferase family 1 protein [Bacillus glycinifermentans]KRT94622.1 glycosyl transferase [Bacillus glycinifermentans]MEC0485708.1 glycosyltransferase family 1 protein [Bacillus glycinifermentans]UOY90414.1 glycosyltransferase family 1 protein [Bacillus glycinifermentans]